MIEREKEKLKIFRKSGKMLIRQREQTVRAREGKVKIREFTREEC